MFLEIFHERGATGADLGIIARRGRCLSVDIACGIFKVAGAERSDREHDGVERLPERRIIRRQREGAQARSRPQIVDEGAVRHRTIGVQFVQKGPQRVVAVINPKQRVHRGDDARLRPRLPAIGLPYAAEPCHPFINQAIGQRRIIRPAVNIGADPLVVDIGIAALGHTIEYRIDARPHARHRL